MWRFSKNKKEGNVIICGGFRTTSTSIDLIINLGLDHRHYNIATRLELWPAMFLIVGAQPITCLHLFIILDNIIGCTSKALKRQDKYCLLCCTFYNIVFHCNVYFYSKLVFFKTYVGGVVFLF